MAFEDKYQESPTQFPDDAIDPKLKDETWHKQWCEAMFSSYVNDRCGILYSKKTEMQNLRLYADGNQPNDKYVDRLCSVDPETKKKVSRMNISWDIISVIPKLREVVVGNLMKIDHDIVASAIDEKSQGEKQDYKFKLYAEKKIKTFVDSINPDMYQGELKEVVDYIPESMQELEMLMSFGGFKLKQEISVEKLINHSFNISNWDNTLKRRIYEDFFDLAVACTKDFVEPATQKVKTRYADPSRMIIAYDRSHTFDNINYAGELVTYTIADLRKCAVNLTEDQIKEIAIDAHSQSTSNRLFDFDHPMNGGLTGSYSYDDIRVQVLDAEWFSYDIKTTSIKPSKNGGKVARPEKFGTQEKSNDKKTIRKDRLKTVHKAKWIVGTEFVFDYGYQNDVPMPNYDECNLSYRIYKTGNKSKVASMLVMTDQIQLAYYRLQNAINNASPAGLAIETGSLENMSLGGKKMGPLDIISIKRDTGDLLFRATTHHTMVISPNAGKPVTELKGGVGPYFDELVKTITINMNLMRDVSGLNEFIDSSSDQNPDMPVATARLAAGAANNVLHTIYLGYQYIKEETAKNFALRYQCVVQHSDVKMLVNSIGEPNVEIIKAGSDISMRDWGIHLELRPDDQMKADIKAAAVESMKARRVGGVGISTSDFMYIDRLIENGQTKLAQLTLAYREEKSQQAMDQQKERMQQIQIEGSIEQEKEKQETVKATEQAKADREIAVETVKSRLRIEEENNRMKNDYTKNQQKSETEMDKKQMEIESQEKNVEKQTQAQKESARS